MEVSVLNAILISIDLSSTPEISIKKYMPKDKIITKNQAKHFKLMDAKPYFVVSLVHKYFENSKLGFKELNNSLLIKILFLSSEGFFLSFSYIV